MGFWGNLFSFPFQAFYHQNLDCLWLYINVSMSLTHLTTLWNIACVLSARQFYDLLSSVHVSRTRISIWVFEFEWTLDFLNKSCNFISLHLMFIRNVYYLLKQCSEKVLLKTIDVCEGLLKSETFICVRLYFNQTLVKTIKWSMKINQHLC